MADTIELLGSISSYLSNILFNVSTFLVNSFNGWFIFLMLIVFGFSIIIYFRFINQTITFQVRK